MEMLQTQLQEPKVFEPSTFEIRHVAGNCISNHKSYGLDTWVVDSGATSHICQYISLFIDLKHVDHVSITMPTHNKFFVKYIGSIQLTVDVVLQDVLFVPTFAYNLLSVSALLKDSKYSVYFHGTECIIQDRSLLKMIGKVDLLDGLYLLTVASFFAFSLYNFGLQGYF